MLRRYLSFLVIVSLVLAGISPACKFISGKNLFEICSFGNEESVSVIDETLLAYLPDYHQEEEHKDLKKECSFCLLHAYGKVIKASEAEAFSGAVYAHFSQPPEKFLLNINDIYTPQIPRAPPSSILS